MSAPSGHPLPRRLPRRRLGAWALAWLLVWTVGGAACGSNVVQATGTGAGTSSTSTTGTPSTSSSSAGGAGTSTSTDGSGGSTSTGVVFDAGDGGCNPVLAPEEMSVVGCFQSTFCPLPTDASAREQLTLALGFCNQEKQPCCEKTVIDQVACGPVGQGGMCCYEVVYATFLCGE